MRRIATALVAAVALTALTTAPVKAHPRGTPRAGQLLRQVDRRARIQHAVTPPWALGTHLKISFDAWQQKRMIKQRARVTRLQRRNAMSRAMNRRPMGRPTTVTTVTTTYRDPYRNGYAPPVAGGAVYSNRSITPGIRLRRW